MMMLNPVRYKRLAVSERSCELLSRVSRSRSIIANTRISPYICSIESSRRSRSSVNLIRQENRQSLRDFQYGGAVRISERGA